MPKGEGLNLKPPHVLWTLGVGDWVKTWFPIGFNERKFLENPLPFWTKIVKAVNKEDLRKGLLKPHAEVGGARFDEQIFTDFVDYTRALAREQNVTDPLMLSEFIEVGETCLFRDGMLPAYFKVEKIGEDQLPKCTPKALNEIDVLRGGLFAEMYRRFLTDSYNGLEPGFKHYFKSRAADIENTLHNLIWQLELPLIGAGQLYQLSTQAESGETVALQEVVLEKMMAVLQTEYTGEQMAGFVVRAKTILQREMQNNRGNIPLCRALGGCLRTILSKAETEDDQKYSQYLAAKIALPEALSADEVAENAKKIKAVELLKGLKSGQIEKSDEKEEFALPISRIKLFWGKLGTDLIDKTWGYDGEANVTEALVINLGRVMTHLEKAPEEVQAAFVEIGEQVLKKVITASEKSQLLSVFESLVSSLIIVDETTGKKPLTSGHDYLAIIRAADSKPFIEAMIADFKDKIIGVGGAYSIVKHLKPEWKKMVGTIKDFPEAFQRKLLDASQSVLDAIAEEPNPLIQKELSLLYVEIYEDTEDTDSSDSTEDIGPSDSSLVDQKPEKLKLRSWVSQAARHQAQELCDNRVLMGEYFADLFDSLAGPCGFGGRVDLSPILLALNMEIISAIGTMPPEKQASFLKAMLPKLEEKVRDSRNEQLQQLYLQLNTALFKEQ